MKIYLQFYQEGDRLVISGLGPEDPVPNIGDRIERNEGLYRVAGRVFKPYCDQILLLIDRTSIRVEGGIL
jgi:hypothetical protein